MVSNHHHRMPWGFWTSPLPILLGTTSKQVFYLALVGLNVCNGALEFWNLVLGKGHWHTWAFTTTTMLVSVFLGAKFPLEQGDIHRFCRLFHTSHQMNGRHWPLIQHPSHPFTKKLRGPAAAIIDHWIGLMVKADVLEIASALIWTTRSPSSNESLAWRRLQQHEI